MSLSNEDLLFTYNVEAGRYSGRGIQTQVLGDGKRPPVTRGAWLCESLRSVRRGTVDCDRQVILEMCCHRLWILCHWRIDTGRSVDTEDTPQRMSGR